MLCMLLLSMFHWRRSLLINDVGNLVFLSIVGADQIGHKCWNTAEVLSILYLTSVSMLLFCDKMLLDMFYWLLPVVISVLGGQLPINMTLVRITRLETVIVRLLTKKTMHQLHHPMGTS